MFSKPWTIVHAVYMTMRPKFYLITLIVLSSLGANGQAKHTVMETATKTITCKLTTPELQKRKATVIADLKALVLERKELENGFSYKFEGTDEILDKLNDFIKTERLCCDFFTFQITVEEQTAVLNITGPNGAKEFLKEEVDL
jgi:hypothetical protein